MSKLFIARYDISQIDFSLSAPALNTWRVTGTIEDPTGSYLADSVSTLDKIIMRGYTQEGYVVYDRYNVSNIVSANGKSLVVDIKYEVPTNPNTQYIGDPIPQIIGNTPITGSFPIGSDLSYKNLLRLPSTYQHLIDPDYMAGMDSLNFEQLVEPKDNILFWDLNKYTAYAAKKSVDPEYAYFYNDTDEDDLPPTFINNKLKLDGRLDAIEIKTSWEDRKTVTSDATIFFQDSSGDSLAIAIGGASRFLSGYATIFAENSSKSLPILIGDYFARDSNQHITIDPDLKVFDIGLDTIHIRNGTALKWLALDVDKNIVYKDEPPMTGYIPYSGATGNVDLGAYGISVSNIRLGSSTTSGYVLTANSLGIGTWQAIPGGGGSMVYPSGSGIPIVASGSSWGTTITDNSSAWNNAEPSLGNPSSNGYVLSSTTSGTRSWISVGGSVPSGTYTGQMLYWDGSNWIASSSTKLLYDDSLGKISLGGGSYLIGGTTGSILYGLHSTRGSAGHLYRPDISSAGSTKKLYLGRHPYITDIIIGDGTGSDSDFGGTANASITFTNYGAGVLITNGSGLISALSTDTGGTRFLREDGSWVAVSGGGGGTGSVTSVGCTVPTGLSVSGVPITTSGTIAIALASGYEIPTTSSISSWNSLTSFPGFGTDHTHAAYGDHTHTGVYQPAGSYQPSGSYENSLGNPSVNGYVLSSTTSGARSWVAQSSGGGAPGGLNGQIQFNNGGSFGGDSNFTYAGGATSWSSSDSSITTIYNNMIYMTDGYNSSQTVLQLYGQGTHAVVHSSMGLLLDAQAVASTSSIRAPNFVLSSDKRLKMNFKCLPDLQEIKYRQFEFIDKPGDIRYGVIAQELMLCHPELVCGDSDGYSVKYIDMLILEVASLKEQVHRLKQKLNII